MYNHHLPDILGMCVCTVYAVSHSTYYDIIVMTESFIFALCRKNETERNFGLICRKLAPLAGFVISRHSVSTEPRHLIRLLPPPPAQPLTLASSSTPTTNATPPLPPSPSLSLMSLSRLLPPIKVMHLLQRLPLLTRITLLRG
jgi:hypothetical protein